MIRQKQIQIPPSSQTSIQSVSVYPNNEMQLRSTFHFKFQLSRPETEGGEKNTMKSVSWKIARALWLAYEMLSIIWKTT